VLKWIFERTEGTATAEETPLGYIPRAEALDLKGLQISHKHMDDLLYTDLDGWLNEIPKIREYFTKFGERMPEAMWSQLDELRERLEQAKEAAA
jgi:phosphoenolpyruvate carboxykinase (GTP)